MTRYVYIEPRSGVASIVDDQSFIAVVSDQELAAHPVGDPDHYEYWDQIADNTAASVIPVLETVAPEEDDSEDDLLGRLSLRLLEMRDSVRDPAVKAAYENAARIANSFED